MAKIERMVRPSEQFVEAEERAFRINQLIDARAAHARAIEDFDVQISTREQTIKALDALLQVAAEVPPLVTGYVAAPGSTNLISSRLAVHDVRQHVRHLAATAKTSTEVRVQHLREQRAAAVENLKKVNEALAAAEQEAA